MLELVGVRSFLDYVVDISLLKRDLLLFDKIGVVSIPDKCLYRKYKIKDKRYFNTEKEWLSEQGILLDTSEYKLKQIKDDILEKQVKETLIKSKQILKKFKKQRENLGKETRALTKLAKLYSGKQEIYNLKEVEIIINKLLKNYQKSLALSDKMEKHILPHEDVTISLIVRVHARNLYDNFNLEAFPILQTMKPLPNIQPSFKKVDVLNVVINSLPIPDELTSWEQILDFRSDPESRYKYLGLRNWMSEIARANLSPNEIEEKLEWLLYSYRKHMELHNLKFKKGVLETIVMSGAEFVENLIKLKFGKAAKKLFSIKHKKIHLMEAEMRAPGVEVSYISSVRKILKNKKIDY